MAVNPPPPFVKTLNGVFVATAHIVSLERMTDEKDLYWRATTADHRTFSLSLLNGCILTQDALQNPETPQDNAA